ncbi:MAG: ATP-dependent DNA helicase RecG [Candidatus Bipolaricaulia bacterium]
MGITDEKQQTLNKLKRIITLERENDYTDVTVIGGLEGFVARAAEMLEDETLQELIVDYANRSVPERRRAISELGDRIRALETGPQPQEDSQKTLMNPVRYAKRVGKIREKQLNRLGIETIADLLLYFPRRIEDRRQVKRIAELRDGEPATVHARVRAKDVIRPRDNLEILKVALQDRSGLLYGIWFNQPWLKSQFEPGERLAVHGKAERKYGQIQMNNPVWEPIDDHFETGRLVAIYPATEGLSQPLLRRIIRDNLAIYLPQVKEVLPTEIREQQGLLMRHEAIPGIHFPETMEDWEQARRTLAFEELFLFQLGVAVHKRRLERQAGRSHRVDGELVERVIDALPFELTAAQTRTIEEIQGDMAAPHPMNRLLQGEVGSGKTVVAAVACLIAIATGDQVAIMAPTEILAEQHYLTLKALFASFPISIELLIGSLPEAEKRDVQARTARGEMELLIGTHALIQEGVSFLQLGLIVIDEQHRFGVIQRAELEHKGEEMDILVMSATPIPRTVTLTLYGQFDISIIDELPPGRGKTETYWVTEHHRNEVYEMVKNELARGRQGYIVYPLVEESEELDLNAATEMKDRLQRGAFQAFQVGLLHGRMSRAEKEAVMERFRSGEIDLLVATTVVEVGIDIPNATVMVIEHADRFGLSQLHQLRGRIGRGEEQAHCYAIASPKTEESHRRLTAFRDIDDGFQIAEEDLKIRGPGELLGTSQHGAYTDFKVADLIGDLEIMSRARQEAFRAAERGPEPKLIEAFRERFGEQFELASV